MGRPGHDAYDDNGDVQIKMTAGKGVGLYSTCERLVGKRPGSDVLRERCPVAMSISSGVSFGTAEGEWLGSDRDHHGGGASTAVSRMAALGSR